MDNQYIISLVIPVYNGEKYLRECVDSILAQSFQGYEIVLVDDGSKDKSGEICKEYAEQHNNIIVIQQDNSGVTYARKRGVEAATGKWIAFVDADDTIPANSLAELYKASIDIDTDIVIGCVNERSTHFLMSMEDYRHAMIKGKYLTPSLWGKLYKKELFDEFVFDIPRIIKKGEDQLMNIRLLFKTEKKPVLVCKNVYNYRRNPLSVSHKMEASIDYESSYDQHRILSIPIQSLSNYMHDIIYIRLNGLIGVAYANPETICYKDQPFLKQLREDITRSHYKMNLQEWMMLNIKYVWMYKCVSFFIMVKNFIRYRLGFNN